MTTVATPPVKRTFKEKLRDLVAHAEQQQAQAIREEHSLDVRSFATDLLMRGYPNAFAGAFLASDVGVVTSTTRKHLHGRIMGSIIAEFHLFAVSEAKEATPQQVGQQGGTNDTIPAFRGPDHEAQASETSLSIPTLRTIHTHLMRAEQARRDDDFHGQSAAYNELGLFFEQVGNLPLAAYQYRRCLDIARELNWLEGCLAAHTTLGLVTRQQGLLEESLKHHEQQQALAEQLDHAEEIAAAQEQLVQARSMLAEAAADAGKHDVSTSHLQGCIAAAQACGNRAAEGACCHQLGLIAQQKGEFSEALQCQDTFLELIGEAGSSEDVARAHFCAAECHEALGDIDRAISELETYLDMTRQSSPLAHGRACCKFGSLCYRMGQFSQAVMYFEKFFEVARNLGDNRILDIARFNLGVARGSVWKQEFLGIVNSDVEKLLNWKNLRIPFTEQF